MGSDYFTPCIQLFIDMDHMMSSRVSLALPSPDIFSGDEDTGDDKERSGTLLNLDLLHCPICVEPFTTPVFQCDNGHLLCSSCCPKLMNKCCPSCTLPIKIRCRAMENIVESITVPCPNSKFGCTKIFSYKDKKKTHEKTCLFGPCSCPLIIVCDYKGHYKDFYHHFDTIHRGSKVNFGRCYCGIPTHISMRISANVYVLKEAKECLLFVVQCFSGSDGVKVNVSCVAPLGVHLDTFSYHLSMSLTSSGNKLTFEYQGIMKRIQEVKFETPKKNVMVVPKCLLLKDEDGSCRSKVESLKI